MKPIGLLYISILIIIFSCSSKGSGEQSTVDSQQTDTLSVADTLSNNEFPDEECVRGLPEPVVIKSKYPDATFKLVDKVGYETLKLENGDILEIENSGCEYYSLTFSVRTTRIIADSTDFKGTCDQFATLLELIKPAVDCPVDLEKASGIIKKFKDNQEGLTFNSEIVIEDGDMRQFANVHRATKISDSESLFSITLSIGPL